MYVIIEALTIEEVEAILTRKQTNVDMENIPL